MILKEQFKKQGNFLFKYRSYFPIPFLLFAIILYVYDRNLEYILYRKQYYYGVYYEYFCLLISFLGLIIRIYVVGHSAKNTSGRNEAEQVADTINKTGLYSVVRHPLYLANFFMWMGPVLLTRNFWFVLAAVLLFWLFYERIMYAEEQYLTEKFGDEYLNWANNVPTFFPKFKGFVKPALPFSWKKVLRQEKNGLFAIFLVFLIFDIAAKTYTHGYDYNQIYIYGSIITAIIYIVLRYLKRKTKLLADGR
ncbi:MAG TPA: isoprenylcysteine carboxylmethyltransferase family protein [Ignavibacteriales bacterium]|nr:isoprenylcysteine carboxylmethyltransferase family protein [Ignavibacteriales bacterium]HOL80403.1 isoprenylcysteine carboxylmethyltransferase family protein [Ignavibacteriales bacterium]HOM64854.1 isoprenylcysteine carboxylmethyltransferase family protein [Ignavibacteriales bacterium]HPD67413.1 isoprenylcysteine carboxylmethyltransferase family protein [Ignavibacteriales bacterium]HPP32592.1 isoprenylcysteine carboxylmethyltransferase family protein [Ignavibacteriales bacterium]